MASITVVLGTDYEVEDWTPDGKTITKNVFAATAKAAPSTASPRCWVWGSHPLRASKFDPHQCQCYLGGLPATLVAGLGMTEGSTMAHFKFDEKGMDDLEKHLQQKFKKIEVEANKAAARETTPDRKAHVFAQVLRDHGVTDVNETELRKKFGGS